MFPNPAIDMFNVLLTEPTGDGDELWVTDLNGKLMASHKLAQGGRSFGFSTEGLANGIYFLKLVQDKKAVSLGRLVIVK